VKRQPKHGLTFNAGKDEVMLAVVGRRIAVRTVA